MLFARPHNQAPFLAYFDVLPAQTLALLCFATLFRPLEALTLKSVFFVAFLAPYGFHPSQFSSF